jgi:hypothetical protein
MIVGVLFFAPLPLSLVVSRVRFQRGDKSTCASTALKRNRFQAIPLPDL